MPNISVVQNPSPALRAVRDLKKVVIGLAVGSIVGGLALALFIELVLDRTVKRSRELEARLHLPLLLTIPALADANGHLRLTNNGNGNGNGEAEAEPETELDRTGLLLRPFCECIRDRLSFHFEMNGLTHKPKLVAVTGLSEGAGVSSLAAGLADAFSETGEHKVALVNKPVPPKQFSGMINRFRESALDYVIFDMPAFGDTSSTLPMAGFMDRVLLVVEAEKSSQQSVKRAYAQLSQKTDVSVVFNKSRVYGPKWLEGEV
jgi:polysaccharide biosynthesis transport protein